MSTHSTIEVAVIPVAGRGTRWLPVSRSVPKELLPVWRRTAASYAVEEALQAGCREIVFVVSPDKQEVVAHFQRHHQLRDAIGDTDSEHPQELAWDQLRVHAAVQEEPLGLGHAVLCARQAIGNRPFALLLPDEVLRGVPGATSQLITAAGAGSSVLLMEVPPQDTGHYGIAKAVDADAKVSLLLDMVEKPAPEQAPSNLAIIGRYILTPRIFDLLMTQAAGHGGEIQLTDALRRMARCEPVHGVRYDGVRHDVGQPLGLLAASVDIALDDPSQAAKIRREIETILRRTRP